MSGRVPGALGRAGAGSKSFDPDGSVTRAMVWTVLARLAGETISVAAWAADALVWATGVGLINGISGELSPAAGASRCQLATMLMRQLQQSAA